jgi:hypothetical protein
MKPVFEAPEIVQMLRECGISEATIAQVLGIARCRLPRWEGSTARPPGVEHLQDLARVVWLFLKAAPTPRDAGRWLCAGNPHLGGRRLIEVLTGGRRPC